jgi:hypothetical protein
MGVDGGKKPTQHRRENAVTVTIAKALFKNRRESLCRGKYEDLTYAVDFPLWPLQSENDCWRRYYTISIWKNGLLWRMTRCGYGQEELDDPVLFREGTARYIENEYKYLLETPNIEMPE